MAKQDLQKLDNSIKFSVMIINEKKLGRQQLSLFKYKNYSSYPNEKRCGILEACTGFGKTFVGILRIMEINKESPESIINVVVPRLKLKDDWIKAGGHIEQHNLKNVNVFVVNSYVNFVNTIPDYLICDFLLLDECHRYAREESEQFSTVVNITSFTESLALTATLNEQERRFLISKGFRIIDNISEEEAEREGWIPPSFIFNLEIVLSDEDKQEYDRITKSMDFHFSLFEHNFDLIRACYSPNDSVHTVRSVGGIAEERKTAQQWTWWWAQQMGWRGEQEHEWTPKKIRENADLFRKAMDERKRFLYNCNSKILAGVQIHNSFKGKRIMFFSESSRFAENLVKAIGRESARAFHSSVASELREPNGKVRAYSEKIKTGKKQVTWWRGVSSNKLWSYEHIKKVIPDIKKFGLDKILAENLSLFEKGDIDCLCTVKKLDEGFNVETIDIVVIASYTAQPRQFIQRKGRASRIDPDNVNKRAIVINMYLKGTQEERAWLKKSQSQSKKTLLARSVEEIVYALDNFSAKPKEEQLMYDNSTIW